MAENVHLAHGDVAITPFFAEIQELLSGSAPAFDLTLVNPTTIQLLAGADDAQKAISIQGRYRYRSTSTSAGHPGGVAGTYNVFVTASDNAFVLGTTTVDDTVYDFGLRILARASFPTTALYRLVGEVEWDGSKITALRVLVGSRRDNAPLTPVAPLATLTPLRVRGAAAQSAPLTTLENAAGTVLVTFTASGGLFLSDLLTVPALTMSGNLVVGGTAQITGAVAVGGSASVTGNLSITGTTVLTGNTTVTGSLTGSSASFSATLSVGANASVGGALTVAGGISAGGNLSLGGNAVVSGVLTVAGLASLDGGATSTTPSPGDNSANLATTAFIQEALTDYLQAGSVTSGDVVGQVSGGLEVLGELGAASSTEWLGNSRVTAPLVLPHETSGVPLRKRFMRTLASDANPRRLRLFYKSRDSASAENSTPVEIVVRTTFPAPSITRSVFVSGSNQAPMIKLLDYAGPTAIVPVLQSPATNLAGTLSYQPVSVDLPLGTRVLVELTYAATEVANTGAITTGGQIVIDGTELSNTGGGTSALGAQTVAQTVSVASWDDQSSPSQPAGSIIGEVPAPVVSGQTLSLIGVMHKCTTVGGTPTVFKIQSDHNGTLQNVATLTSVQPAAGRFVETVLSSPLALSRGDSTAVVLVTPGSSLGCKVALIFGRAV